MNPLSHFLCFVAVCAAISGNFIATGILLWLAFVFILLQARANAVRP